MHEIMFTLWFHLFWELSNFIDQISMIHSERFHCKFGFFVEEKGIKPGFPFSEQMEIYTYMSTWSMSKKIAIC